MSILSNLKKSRQKAKDHNAKLAEQKQQESTARSYRHVPTHAATDAIAAAPPSWREADRPKIMEQNRRRSAMAAAGHHMNIPGIPRVGSSLSHVSYPSGESTPIVGLPRPYSFQGVSPYSSRGRDVVYSVPDLSYSQPPSLKGKEVLRLQGWETGRRFTRETMPLDGSGGSDSSDDLEMPRRPRSRSVSSLRLRSNHPGRTSDGSINNIATSSSARASTDALRRDTRLPPTSTRGFASIPASLQLPLPVLPGSLPISAEKVNAMLPTPILAHNSRESSAASLPDLTPTSSKPASAPMTPSATAMNQQEFNLKQPSDPESSSSEDGFRMLHGQHGQPVPRPKFKERKSYKTTRFVELERIDSHIEDAPVKQPPEIPIVPVPQGEILNAFPEMVPDDDYEPSVKGKSKKKSAKTGGRLTRKNRSSKS